MLLSAIEKLNLMGCLTCSLNSIGASLFFHKLLIKRKNLSKVNRCFGTLIAQRCHKNNLYGELV